MVVDLWIEVFGLAVVAFLSGLVASWVLWKLGAALA
jgi:hypothetical protein